LPDFNRARLLEAFVEFQRRERGMAAFTKATQIPTCLRALQGSEFRATQKSLSAASTVKRGKTAALQITFPLLRFGC